MDDEAGKEEKGNEVVKMKVTLRKKRLQIIVVLLLFLVSLTAVVIAQSTGYISGKIYDKETNQSIKDVRVIALNIQTDDGTTAIATEDGIYLFSGLPTGTYDIYVEAAGYSSDLQKEVTLQEGQNLQNTDIYLPKGGIISGYVKNNKGLPLSGVEVFAIQSEGTSHGKGKTDEEGLFRISGLAEGDFNVSVKTPGHIPETKENVTVSSGELTSGIDFLLVASGSLSGKVTKQDGVPVAEAEILVIREEDKQGKGIFKTDINGDYKADNLGAGTYTITIKKDGFVANQNSSVSVTEGTNTESINFVLEEAGSISGTIYLSDGITPAAGIFIFAQKLNEDSISFSTPDGSGQYKIENVSTGFYTVRAEISDSQILLSSSNVEVRQGNDTTDVNFILPGIGAISGTAYKNNDTMPFEGATVTLVQTEGLTDAARSVTTASNGSFIFENVPAGGYVLLAEAPGYPSLKKNVTVNESQAQIIQFTLSNLKGSISGKVTTQDNQPVSGVRVVAFADEILGDNIYFTETTQDGSYKIESLFPSENYQLTAFINSYKKEVKEDVKVEADNETKGVNFIFVPE